jgi:PST family polysaccharide transporter
MRQQIRTASLWSLLSEAAVRIVTPLVFLILARLLTPADFGLVAAAMIVVSLAQLIGDAGMSRALVQSTGETVATANTVFWMNLALGFVVYVILFLLADLAAQPFGDPRAAAIIKVQGLQVIFMPFVSVHKAVFQKDLNFRPLLKLQLVAAVVPGLISVPFAIYGMGYWALVWGSLIATVVQAIVVWRQSSWRPRFAFDRKIASGLLGFSAWSSGQSIVAWFYQWGDTFFVGIVLSSAAMGLYRTGSSLIIFVFAVAIAPLQPVLFSAFSRLQDNLPSLGDALGKANKAIVMVSFPIATLVFVFQDAAESLVFNEKWQGIAPVIGWAALTQGLAWTVGSNAQAYSAAGRPDVVLKLNLVLLCAYVPVYWIAIQAGLETFLKARFALTLIAIPVHLYVAKRLFGTSMLSFIDQIKWSLIASVSLALVILLLSSFVFPEPSIPVYTLIGFAGICVYVLLMWREWPFAMNLLGLASESKTE